MPVASRLIGPIVVGLALLSALATFLVLVGLTPVDPDHYAVVNLLAVNATDGLLLVVIIVREVWPAVQARRRGRAGARLHVDRRPVFGHRRGAAVLVAMVGGTTLDAASTVPLDPPAP